MFSRRKRHLQSCIKNCSSHKKRKGRKRQNPLINSGVSGTGNIASVWSSVSSSATHASKKKAINECMCKSADETILNCTRWIFTTCFCNYHFREMRPDFSYLIARFPKSRTLFGSLFISSGVSFTWYLSIERSSDKLSYDWHLMHLLKSLDNVSTICHQCRSLFRSAVLPIHL